TSPSKSEVSRALAVSGAAEMSTKRMGRVRIGKGVSMRERGVKGVPGAIPHSVFQPSNSIQWANRRSSREITGNQSPTFSRSHHRPSEFSGGANLYLYQTARIYRGG